MNIVIHVKIDSVYLFRSKYIYVYLANKDKISVNFEHFFCQRHFTM